MQELILPLSIDMGVYKRDTKKNKIGDSKKPFRINFNQFRNANTFYRTVADQNFREFVTENFSITPVHKLVLFYKLTFKDRRSKDVNNIVSILDKFFCDTLTELSIIPDDNYKFIPAIISSFNELNIGGEEYCTVYLFDITKEEDRELLSDMFMKHITKLSKM